MKCITFANDAYAPMVNEYLLPTTKAFEVIWVKPQVKEECLFGSRSFRTICHSKPYMIRRHMETMPLGEVFLYVDGDIEFFGLTPQMILEDLGDGEVACHAEFPGPSLACTGAIAMRNTEYMRAFVERWSTKTIWSDEEYFNELVDTESESKRRFRWLPTNRYWNVSQAGLGYVEPFKDRVEQAIKHVPKDIRLFHANFAVGLKEKTELLAAIRNEVYKKL